MLAALRKDPFVATAIALAALPIALSAARLIGPGASAWWATGPAELVLLAVVLAAFGFSRAPRGHREERWFWSLLFVTFSLWLAGGLVSWLPDALLPSKSLYLLSYVAMIAAADVRPHLPEGWTRRSGGFRFALAASVVLVAGLVWYFFLVPETLQPPTSRWLEAQNVFLALDVVLLLRFAHLAVQAGRTPWGTVYGWLAASSLASVASEGLNVYLGDGGHALAYGTPLDAVWWMPFVCAVVARRVRHHQAASRETDAVRTAAPSVLPDDEPRTSATELMLIYAFAFPAMHLVLEAGGGLGDPGEVERAIVVLATLLALMLLAIAQHRRLERRTRALRSEIRVLVTNEQMLQSQKMEAVGRLAGGLAHDFNNLLMVVGARAEMLSDALGREDPRRRDVEEIRHAVNRGAAFTRQLLAFNRRQAVKRTAVDLSAAVLDAEELLRRLAGEGITLETRVSAGLAPVDAEASQVFQVLMNLVANAREAMPNGGTITIATSSLDVSEDGDGFVPHCPGGTFTALEVQDTGTGIEPEALDRIFEPFYTSKVGGTGLGLAVVYAIVTQSGGYVRARSERGRGATFTVVFPPTAGALVVAPPPAAPAAPAAVPPRTVLLVEDQEPVRVTVRTMLDRLGYRVVEAASGSEAVEQVSLRGVRPDILLTDVVMPGMRGPEVAKRVRSVCPDVRVIFVSGFVEDQADAQIVGDADADFLAKPFTLQGLGEKLRATAVEV